MIDRTSAELIVRQTRTEWLYGCALTTERQRWRMLLLADLDLLLWNLIQRSVPVVSLPRDVLAMVR